MTLPYLSLVVSLLASTGFSSIHAAPPSAPTETRLVDSYEQLGIDTAAPRFGWIVNDSDRSERQTAYQILVAASEAELNSDQGTRWDSGKIASAQQFGVTYAGAALAKTTRYWWKVRTWDKDDQASPWSEAKNFVTSFFQASDWNAGAQWIQHPTAGIDAPIMLRKSFSVAKPIRSAFFYVSGLGQFVASLNGSKIGNHELDPAWTHYNYSMTYVAFDVTAQLQPGQNALGIMLGSGWTNSTDNGNMPSFGRMRAYGQLHIDYTDGTSEDVVTDPSWKVSTSPFTYTDVHGGENYDARLEQAGWNTAAFNDSAWVAASVGTPPKGKLVPQSAPPLVVKETLPGTLIASPSANNYVYDFGKNVNGVYEVKVSGKAGDVVAITLGEYRNGNGTVNAGRSRLANFTLKGGGVETRRLTFSTMGMRFVQVGGVSTNSAQTTLPFLQSVTCDFVYSASDNIGSFTASDDRYNQIHSLVLNSLRSNLVSIHTDCPNYEKLGWQEVAWTLLPGYTYQHDVFNIYSKILRDVREGQRTNGLAPTIAPNLFAVNESPPGGQYDDSPAWGSSLFLAPWQLYQAYGDKQTLELNYEAMKRYLAYLKTKESNGVMPYGLGDWMAPAGHQERNVEGGVYVLDTRIVRDVATILGKTADATFYGNEFTRVRNAYNNAYFDSANGRYNPLTQGNQAMPLTWGIVPDGREKDVVATLVRDISTPSGSTADGGKNGQVKPDHITTGDVGTTFLLRALGDAGRHDLAHTMITQPDSPGYMAMIAAGHRTLVENWNLGNIRSYNHDMMGGVFEWFYRTPAGISALEPGYARIQLKPGMPSSLTSVTASSNSVRGVIGSAWTVSGDQIVWNVRVPVNATARICVPTRGTPTSTLTISEGGTPIYVNGASTGSVPGLVYDRTEGTDTQTYVVWNAGSGNYQFSWRIIPAPTGLTATAGVGQIGLTWAAASGATSYYVKRATVSGGPYANLADNVTGTTFTDPAVSNNTTYYYVVSALLASGESANSLEASAKPVVPGNYGFETPSIGTFQYNPSGATWTFTAQSGNTGSGISANGSGFTSSNAAAPEGAQVAMLQGLGTITRSISTTPGVAYGITFSAAQRVSSNSAGQTWDLRRDGAVIASYAPGQSATAYTDYPAAFVATAANHTLAFVGTNTRGGDNTILLDNVRLVAIGTVIGTTGSGNNNPAAVFDGNLNTAFDAAQADGAWVGLDLATPRRITSIRYAPRTGNASRMVGGKFQASNTADFNAGVVDLYTVTAAPTVGVLTAQTITNPAGYRYVRYLSPNNGFCNLAEFQLTSVAASPAAPTALTATGGDGTITLTWTAVPGADTYSVKAAAAAGGPYAALATGLNTPGFAHSGLGNGITRYYVATSTNEAGESGNSSEASATTYTAAMKWRLANFGTTASSGDAADSADPDGDGSANAQEFAAGTDPKNSASAFRITQFAPNGGGWRVSFPTVSGKTYRLQSSPSLKSDSWTTVQDSIAGTGGLVQIADPANDAARQRFYRAVLVP